MRCLAFAQAWQSDGGKIVFLMAPGSPGLEQRILVEGMEILTISEKPGSCSDAGKTIETAKKMGASWVIVDGYQFGAGYQKKLKENGCRILFIDDYGHADHYFADIILNQNPYASPDLYPNCEKYTRLLLGTQYALLRKEFLIWSDWDRPVSHEARKILVTLGGSDGNNVTLEVIEALSQVTGRDLEVIIVTGTMNQYSESLQAKIKDMHGFSIRHDVKSMPELMQWADIAISGGGSTCWELAFMGLPNIIISIADNQRPNARWLDAHNIAMDAGDFDNALQKRIKNNLNALLNDDKKRQTMAKNAKRLVNGKGSKKIIQYMQESGFSLRQATKNDSKKIWEWVNDVETRLASFNSRPIIWDEHNAWFASRLHDPNCSIFILETREGRPIGQIRFDIIEGIAEIDVSIDKTMRGRGVGTHLIQEGICRFFELTGIQNIQAHVKAENIASVKSFERANFKIESADYNRGYKVIHLVWRGS